MPKSLTVAEFLESAISLSGKTQKEIAEEVGYPKPNVLSMMKQGLTKVPVDKVPALAKATGVDSAAFLRLVLREYMSEAWMVIHDTLGDIVTEDEKKILSAYRAARDANPKIADANASDLQSCLEKVA